ncbi:MAG: hypothetical protein MZV64_38095 [Ignavibacteriales bacterium]|nr:hypothetical protein [Ignavibacteriales bacterium]
MRLEESTHLPVDVHLMIKKPDNLLEAFAKSRRKLSYCSL